LFLNKTIKGVSNYSKASDEVVGQVGKTVTALGPTGFVLLDGVKLEAASKSGFIEKNEQVKVTGNDNFRIIVSKI
jgi:membrane-bound serine protease (ClpP class)